MTMQDTTCPRCQGVGYYKLAVPMGDPRWGKAQRCPCQKAADDARAWARVQAASHYTVEMDHMTFQAWDRTCQEDAYRTAAAFATGPHPGWVVLQGTNGTGKTHLLAATLHAMRKRGRYPLYAVTPRLLDYLREGIGSHDVEKRLALVERADVLLLDEMGADDSSDWALARLTRVLDYRYANRLPTMIATNEPADLWPYRLASRAGDEAVVRICDLLEGDYRKRPMAARVATTPRPERTTRHGR